MKDVDMEEIKSALIVNRMVEALLDVLPKGRKVTVMIRDSDSESLDIFCTNETDADAGKLVESLRKELAEKAQTKKDPEYVFVGSNDGIVN